MTAIVTDAFKHKIAEDLFTELGNASDANEFYIGIGKTDQYDSSDTTITPLRHQFDDRIARGNLESVKKVTAQSFVVARNNWTSGTTYDAWNDKQVGYSTNPYYVLTEDNEVYICLQQSKSATGTPNPSTVKPSYTNAAANANHSFKTSDGYRWKFLYSISAGDATNFLTSAFIPTQKITVDSASTNAFTILQKNVQSTAVPGQIMGVEVVNGGDGYTSAPTITFGGNNDSGEAASATAFISGGAIVKVEMTGTFDSGMGRGYDFASATVTGNATLRPIIGPRDGFGADARRDLKSSSIMMNAKTDGTENDTFNITNDFRQITLLQNPTRITDSAAAGSLLTAASLKVGKLIRTTAALSTTGFVVDEKITGGTTGATAFIDEVDSNGGKILRIHQNEKTVNKLFQDGETITGSSGGSGTIDSSYQTLANGNVTGVQGFAASTSPHGAADAIDIYSGDLLYLENRARIVRSSAQTEDIKVIITV